MDRSLGKELAPGLVVHLDPEELLVQGATHTVDEAHRVQGQHFFLCVEVQDDTCRLVPLFTNDNPGRLPLSTEGRSGHEKWANGTFHYYPNQVWSATRGSVVAAAAKAHDKSRSGFRNALSAEFLPEV